MSKLRYYISILFLLFSICTTCLCQTNSTYIGFYENKIALKGFLANDFLMMSQNIDIEKENEIKESFQPNNPIKLGGGISINGTLLSFSYGYGFNFLKDKKYGKTKFFDFQFHNYGRKFVFDLYIQKYKGFYSHNEDKKITKIYPDVEIQQYGLNTQYVFNNKKFSYKAAFDQSEKQLKSAGSILAGVGVYASKIKSDSTFSYEGKNRIKNYQLGLSAGYAYTWVINPKWYINGSVTAGVSIGFEEIKRMSKNQLILSPNVFPRISVGYNREDWALRFSYVNNVLYPSFSGDSYLSLQSGNFQFTYTKRLENIPLLKKIPIINKMIE